MINIRKGLFETNSSSTHAICIGKDNHNLEIPSELTFQVGEFGWEERFLYDIEDRASYLYTLLLHICDGVIEEKLENIKNHIYELLGSVGCDCEFIPPTIGKYGWLEDGYVDHDYEAVDFVRKIINNDKMLLKYLFSPDSFIVTGNDNSEWFDEWADEFEASKESKKVDIYYKWN